MKYSYLLFTILLLINCSNSTSKTDRPKITGSIKADLLNLLPVGSFEADIMTDVNITSRQEELTKKFQEGIQKNQEWFIEYMKKYEKGKMPYDPKFGITEEEFKELQSFMNNIELKSAGQETLNILKKDGVISFNAKGNLAAYNFVKINLNDNSVIIDKYKLLLSDTPNVQTETNGLRSKWKGYTWKFEDPKDISLDALHDMSNLNIKKYSLTIGQLEKNDKTFLKLEAKEIKNGVKALELELPLIF